MWSAFVNYFSPSPTSQEKTHDEDKDMTETKIDSNKQWDVSEITPFEEYDANKAKLRICIQWLIHKAYNEKGIPESLQDPFHIDSEMLIIGIKPELVHLMTSGEIYLQICAYIFKESPLHHEGWWFVIQQLSKRGLYVVGDDESAVTETDLKQKNPFLLNSHVALIDALMQAYTKETVTIERVVQAVRRFSSVNASSELPFDLEDALLFWMNKACSTVRYRLDKEKKTKQQQLMQQQTPQRVRINKKQLAPKESPSIPVMDDLLKDLSDGCCLASVVHFYCPDCLSLDDICLKNVIGIADSIYNIQLIERFCKRDIPFKCFHFYYEDLMYSHSTVKQCVIAFLAELFYWFEVEQLDCVIREEKAKGSVTASTATHPPLGKKLRTTPSVPISSVTKKSFQNLSSFSLRTSSSASNPELNIVPGSPSHVAQRQQLLTKRQRTQQKNLCHDENSDLDRSQNVRREFRKSQSLNSAQERDVIQQSVVAWENSRGSNDIGVTQKLHSMENSTMSCHSPSHSTISSHTSCHSKLLSNVSIDDEMNQSFNGKIITSRDLDIDKSPPPRIGSRAPINAKRIPAEVGYINENALTKSNPDYMELESVSSVVMSARSNQSQNEPLMPAKLKTSKERVVNHSKEYERGEANNNRLSQLTNTLSKDSISTTSSSQSYMNNHSKLESEIFTSVSQELPSGVDISNSYDPSSENSIYNLNNAESANFAESVRNESRVKPPAQSFTIQDHPHSPNSARAAGIPIVGSQDYSYQNIPRYCSNESCESQKIHDDQNVRESEESFDKNESFYLTAKTDDRHSFDSNLIKESLKQSEDNGDIHRPDSLFVPKPITLGKTLKADTLEQTKSDGMKQSPTTSFAEIKRWRDSMTPSDSNLMLFVQHGAEKDRPEKISLKSEFQKKQGDGKTPKKTTFASLPNQTTWQENAQKSAQIKDSNKSNDNDDSVEPLVSELTTIRLQLEQKRKAIEHEKRRMEATVNKQRQRVGKAAFMHVVSKNKSGEGDSVLRTDILSTNQSTAVDTKKHDSKTRSQTDEPHEQITDTAQKLGEKDVCRSLPSYIHSPQQSVNVHDKCASSQPKQQIRPVGQVVSRSLQHAVGPIANQPSLEHRPQQEERCTLSRREIQETLDNVRRKWLSDQSSSWQQPVQIEARNEHIKSGSPSPRSIGSGSDHADYEEYNQSLDKLNHSLSDLQGEIMRLSLQQEQIKNMSTKQAGSLVHQTPTGPVVHHSPTGPILQHSLQGASNVLNYQIQPQQPTNIIPPPVRPSQVFNGSQGAIQIHNPHFLGQQLSPSIIPRTQPFVLHQQPSVYTGATVATGIYSPAPVPVLSNVSEPALTHQSGLGAYMLHQPTPVYQSIQPAPRLATHVQQPYMMHGQGYAPVMQVSVTTSSQQLPQIPSHQAHFEPQPRFATTYTVNQQPTTFSAVSSSSSSSTLTSNEHSFSPLQAQGLQISDSPPECLHISDSSQQSEVEIYSTESSPLKNIDKGQQHTAEQFTPIRELAKTYHRPSPVTSPPDSYHSNSPARTDVSNGPGDGPHDNSSTVRNEPLGQEEIHVESPEDDCRNQQTGFFISFGNDDSNSRKPIPKHKMWDRSRNAREQNSPRSQQTPERERPIITPVSAPTEDSALQGDTGTKPKKDSLGFVIGEDQRTIDAVTEIELQKKKEKIMLQQLRRREEQERKRLEKEVQLANKREDHRLKQLEAGQKKADEKARRAMIYQQYMDRKAEEEELENPRPPPKPRSKSNKNSKTPVPSADRRNMQCQQNTQFEDDYSRSPGVRNNDGTLSYVYSDHMEGSQYSYAGGLTHRAASPGFSERPQLTSRKGSGLSGFADNGSDSGSLSSMDYAGPKLYVKPSAKSNRHIIINAISHVCLAGSVNNDLKNKVLEEIAKSNAKHFIILFRDHGLQYRAFYSYCPDTEDVIKVHGMGPKQITGRMIDKFYKYNSGGKSFAQVSSMKHLSLSIDAITIQNALWSKKPATKKPPSYR